MLRTVPQQAVSHNMPRLLSIGSTSIFLTGRHRTRALLKLSAPVMLYMGGGGTCQHSITWKSLWYHQSLGNGIQLGGNKQRTKPRHKARDLQHNITGTDAEASSKPSAQPGEERKPHWAGQGRTEGPQHHVDEPEDTDSHQPCALFLAPSLIQRELN